MSVATRAIETIRSEGFRSFGWRSAKWLTNRFAPSSEPLATIHREDALAVDWTAQVRFNAVPRPGRDGRYHVAWIISPPSRSSGG
ncbi:MAG: hypothetical protein V4479_11590, partial [Actinomycetota bacterium]